MRPGHLSVPRFLLALIGAFTLAPALVQAQTDSTRVDSSYAAPALFDSTWTHSAEPYVFSGSARVSGQFADRSGTYQLVPNDFVRFEVKPTLAVYGAPFSAWLLFSTENSTARQRINSVAFGFDYYKLQGDLLQRAYDKVADLEELKAAEEAAGGIEHLRDSLSALGEDKLRDLDRLKDLASYEGLRDRAISESMAELESLGLVSETESFFMNFPALELGVTYPNYSELTVRGVPVTGGNVEFNPGNFYVAASGGRSQGFVPLPGAPNLFRSAEVGQPEPSYERTMAAGRLGYGRKEGGHIFLTALYAIDDEATLPLDTSLLADTAIVPLSPKANYLFGIDGRMSIADDQLQLGAEIATSVLTGDLGSSGVQNDDIPGFVVDLVEPTVSTFVDYSYKVTSRISIHETDTKINANVRMVGPGFVSLGAPTLRNDNFSYEARIDQRLMKRQITLSGFFRNQRDNLIEWKPSTTTVGSWGAGLALNFRQLPYLRLNYSPYSQKNEFTNDTFNINSETTVFSALTGYSYRTGSINNSSNLSYSLQRSISTGLSQSEYSVGTLSVNHTTFFPFNLAVSGGLGLSSLKSGPDFSSQILSAEVSGSYTVMELLTVTAGASIANETDVDDRAGFFGGGSLALWGYGVLDLFIEKNRYNNVFQNSNNFDELVFRAMLTTQW
jgi:hypothetical protein